MAGLKGIGNYPESQVKQAYQYKEQQGHIDCPGTAKGIHYPIGYVDQYTPRIGDNIPGIPPQVSSKIDGETAEQYD